MNTIIYSTLTSQREPAKRIELSTPSLPRKYSTPELRRLALGVKSYLVNGYCFYNLKTSNH
jgi:hypothetical protein